MNESDKRRIGGLWIEAKKFGGWRRGMFTVDGRLWWSTTMSGSNYCTEKLYILKRDVPDVEHPGNIGFLTADVREAYKGYEVEVHPPGLRSRWHVCARIPGIETLHFEGDSEPEALVNALRSASADEEEDT